jgi:hypothetical protein
MRKYFIGYMHSRGFGTIALSRPPIESYDDVQDAQQQIRNINSDSSVVIISIFPLAK